MPFETGRSSILAVPLPVGTDTVVVLELFDKPALATVADRKLVAGIADVGADLLRQAFAEPTHQLLFDAVETALGRRPASPRCLPDRPRVKARRRP